VPERMPVVRYLVLGERPHLVAQRCAACGALFLDRRNACARCGADEFDEHALATTGALRSFTIVHRSAPGVDTPYISAVVDLDGGGIVKSTLVGLPVEPGALSPRLRVRLVTFSAGVDDRGTEAIGFRFEPGEEVAA